MSTHRPIEGKTYDHFTIYKHYLNAAYGVDKFGEKSPFGVEYAAWGALWDEVPPDLQEQAEDVHERLLPQLRKAASQPDFDAETDPLIKQLYDMGVPEDTINAALRLHNARNRKQASGCLGWLRKLLGAEPEYL